MGERRRGERGQGMVELAVLVPILVLITMGALDFGRIFFAYTSMVDAAREGALHASLRPGDTGGISSVVAAELGGQLPGGVTTSVSGGGGPGSPVTVTVRYDFPAITTAVVGRRTVPISTSATMVVQ